MNWSNTYQQLTNRNIGLLTEAQQEKLRTTRVAVCGLGGIGSPIAEMLCRLGIGSFHILDHGTFEPTNLNRQIYSFVDTDTRLKTDVTDEFLRRINPEVECAKFEEITTNNVAEFLLGVDIIVLGIDTVKPCIIISREARRLKIPIVEGWAVVAGNVRVFTPETPSLEEVYSFPTAGRNPDNLTPEEETELLLLTLSRVQEQIQGLSDFYPPAAMQRIEEKGEGTTLAPLVWLTCSLMATEVMKLLLNWGQPALAPHFASYNPIVHRTMNS